MAGKKAGKKRKKSRKSGPDQMITTVESIGSALGQVAARLDVWKQQRSEIAADIRRILRTGENMLGELGEVAGRHGGKLLRPTSPKGGRPKGYRTSEATKRKLREAWKRRRASAAAAKGSKTKE